MDNFPVFLNYNEIIDFADSLQNIDDQLKFYKYCIKVFNELKKCENNSDVDNFIKNYSLKDKYLNMLEEYTKDEMVRAQYNRTYGLFADLKYINLFNKVYLLEQNINHNVGELSLYKSTISDNFELVFYQNDIDYKFHKLKDNHKRLRWIAELNRKLDTIYMMFSDNLFSKIYELYDLETNFPKDNIPKWKNNNGYTYPISKYQKLRDYLCRFFLPLLRKEQKKLEMIVTVEDTKYYLEKGITSEDRIFPEWGYKYDKAKEYSNKALPDLRLKMLYFKFLKSRCQNKMSRVPSIEFGLELKLFENEFDYLKCKYDSERDTLENTKTEKSEKQNKPVRKRNEYGEIIKHYFETAVGLNDIPRLKDLEKSNMSSSFWNKKFRDKFFLAELLKRIDRKLKSKRINTLTGELYTRLKDDMNSKLGALFKKERESIGTTNSKSKSYDDRFSRDTEENSYD